MKYPICHECGNEHPPLSKRQKCPQKLRLCEECGKEHIISFDCPNIPCKICFKEDHHRGNCPFLKSYPRGAVFDSTKYEVVCYCGEPFDTDKWVSTRCTHPPQPPTLQPKYCKICQVFEDHVTLDCPKARQLVADYKSSGNDTYLSPELLLNKWKKSTGSTMSSSLGRQEYMDPIPAMIHCLQCGDTHYPYGDDDCPFKPVLCSECGKTHKVCPDCPNVPCKICYKKGHKRPDCPYIFEYPRGANFNETNYQVVCICGNNTFDTRRWVCTSCNWTIAKLRLKSCDTCHAKGDHVPSECPQLRKSASRGRTSSSDMFPMSFCNECGNVHFRLFNQPCPFKLVHCNQCGKEHIFTPDCPYVPCKICYKENHFLGNCPFLLYYPRGENFDSTAYEIVCRRCGMPFDTNTWLCTYCTYSPVAKLQLKRCEICGSTGDHITFECPGDEELAAASKSEHYARHAARHRKVDWCSSQI